ncbi:T9SS type A sorting domain-containing protein [Tamlana fucoidanivorans]|uniref:T9SS type A sorting domain-containing protein n=1 Tax=Allotamlana fucoidanivorans TaxID=2583814 RepID=A0A5C4SQ10_9FLAO|nr:T9SS type A sorting domain-containing protein [Tamlana fucoidanivorans]TNJ46016.1 T9SS type A sorting domain-containing protein [Tamlana fucoidanivorans]
MKNFYSIKFLFVLSFLATINSIGQTTLSPGDLMIFAANSDTSTLNEIGSEGEATEFAFILLKPITTGTQVYFTDFAYIDSSAPYFGKNENNGCDPGAGAQGDGMIKWTANSDLEAGTKVLIRFASGGTVATVGTVVSIVDTVVPGTSMFLSDAGDAIHVFQGSDDGAGLVTAATMISSYKFRDGWQDNLVECDNNSGRSEDPGTGFEFDAITNKPNDNSGYIGDFIGSVSTIQAKLLDIANYQITNGGAYSIDLTSETITLSNKDNNVVESNVKVFPNPAKDVINVRATNGILIEGLEVYNITGRLLKKQSEKMIDISGLSSGMYLLKVDTDRGGVIQKVVKQ